MSEIITHIAQIIKKDEVNLPNKDPNISQSVQSGLEIVFGLAGAVAFIMVVLAGFKYVTSQGNPQEVAKAKDSLINAIIGLVIALFAFTLVRFVAGGL